MNWQEMDYAKVKYKMKPQSFSIKAIFMAKYHCKKSHAMRILAFGPFRDELMFSFPSRSLSKLAETKSQLFFSSLFGWISLCYVQ